MINLIRAEFKKIFKKKSFLIVTIIFILYSILTNILYKNMDELNTLDSFISIKDLEEENKGLDLNNKEDLNLYFENLSTIEVLQYEEKLSQNEQKYLIERFLKPLIDNYVIAKFNSEEELANTLNEEINTKLTKIKNNDWQYFTNNNLTTYKANLNKSNDLSTTKRYETLIKLEEYRLNNNIRYNPDNYLNIALLDIETDITEYFNLQYNNHKTNIEEDRYTYLQKEMQLNKYIIENKMDLNNNETLRQVLSNFPDEFGLFILIYVIMVSGSIVSEEYSKGTIKYLLTKPHKRSTILTSKLITIILFIPLIMLFLSIIEIIIGGFILGFDTLNIPIIIYNLGNLHSYHVLTYLVLVLLSNIPMYLILALISFSISTITASSSAAITVGFLLYLVGNVIANLALTYKFKILNYFFSLHWDFRYLIDKIPNPNHFKPKTSLIVLGIYIFVILCITYFYFKKKDVKNI